jgi:hypothetical protein|tara:strand:+ start:314 stop:523 length:210 start_codon:yes stop_codon:yes gene_type:complete
MVVLTVLDFEDGLVYQYHIDITPNSEADRLNRLGELDFEKIIIDQGHNLNDCEWMSHSDGRINMQKIEL